MLIQSSLGVQKAAVSNSSRSEFSSHGQAILYKDEMNKTLLKGIGCVLAGMVTGAVPAIVTDVILEKQECFPASPNRWSMGSTCRGCFCSH